jgi:predicted deacetylase
VSWRALRDEIALWRAEGRRATFWWRDDDATARTVALDRLLKLAEASGAPVALAVPPAEAEAALGGLGAPLLQHGFVHRNHAPAGERRAEFGPHRPLAVMRTEIAAGRERMAALYGPAFRPVFVPPWNRIAASARAALPALGFAGCSTLGPRDAPQDANVHCDLMLWRPERRFAGEAAARERLRVHLAARRQGTADADEPTGVVSHHLAHDEPAWLFLERLLGEISSSDGAHWLSVDGIFRLRR